jgi:hypothetical protein
MSRPDMSRPDMSRPDMSRPDMSRPDMSKDDREADPWLIDAYTCCPRVYRRCLHIMSTSDFSAGQTRHRNGLTAVEDRAMPGGVKTAPGHLGGANPDLVAPSWAAANQGGGTA